ncbi:MAG TPA: NHL repeat-containing protein, partial [Candidatus Binatia bacterium]|nr:NHL repeat-containing protein [Candidatus Binatia bacterium]
RLYAGKTPNANITDYPVVIAGHRDLSAYENLLSDRDYEKHDYIFLWWPMEEYRKISWNAILGLSDTLNAEGNTSTGRGIFSPDVRKALWDIFFYRDYTKYSEIFGNVYTDDKWRLRAELRLYIRRDVLAELWDYGVNAARIEPPVDPYAEGVLQLTPDLVIGAGGLNPRELLTPRNLALGPDGNLYVLDSGNHRVLVFDQDGALLHTWGGPGEGEGQFNEPWGIAVDDEYVYIADTWNHRIQKFTLDGQFVTTFGQSGSAAELGDDSGGYFFGPRSITLLGDNQILISDTGNHRFQIYDRDGTFIRTFGRLGSDPGQFDEPVGLASNDQWIYLADTWNARIQRFTSDLVPDLNWSIDGWEGDSTENKPYLALDSEGRVYASDPENARILIFSSDGQYLARFGQPGSGIDALGLPNGIAVDEQGNVYVADARNNRILRFAASNFANIAAPDAAPESGAEEIAPEDDSSGGQPSGGDVQQDGLLPSPTPSATPAEGGQ